MKMTPVSLDSIPKARYDKAKVYGLLEMFASSDMSAARLDVEYPQEYSCAGSLVGVYNRAIKRYKFHGIHCISRKGIAYLIKDPT